MKLYTLIRVNTDGIVEVSVHNAMKEVEKTINESTGIFSFTVYVTFIKEEQEETNNG